MLYGTKFHSLRILQVNYYVLSLWAFSSPTPRPFWQVKILNNCSLFTLPMPLTILSNSTVFFISSSIFQQRPRLNSSSWYRGKYFEALVSSLYKDIIGTSVIIMITQNWKLQNNRKLSNGMFSGLFSISVLILHMWFALLNATKHWADIFQDA